MFVFLLPSDEYRLQSEINAEGSVSRINSSHYHSLKTQAIVFHSCVTARHRLATKSCHVKRLRHKGLFATATNSIACDSSNVVNGLVSNDWLMHNSSARTEWRPAAVPFYNSLCNSRIIFNGTFPIDRPFGLRKSLCDARQQVHVGAGVLTQSMNSIGDKLYDLGLR